MVISVRRHARLATALATIFFLGCSSPSDGSPPDTEPTGRDPIATAGGIAVLAAAAPAPPLETGPMAVYLILENRGSMPDTLIGVSSPSASRGSVHATATANGMSGMGPAGPLAVEPGGSLRMEPGGLHIMLDGLGGPVHAGDSLVVQIRLSREGDLTFTIPVVTYADVQGLLGSVGAAASSDPDHAGH